MHVESLELMNWLLRWVPQDQLRGARCVDVGSYDVNGSYRTLAGRFGLRYVGCDVVDGPNVDFVIDPNGWSGHEQFDVVLSGQCLEHVKRPWEWMQRIRAMTKPGGVAIVIAPYAWPIHRHPVDCFRILPDGMASLCEYAGFTPWVLGRQDHEPRDGYRNGDTFVVASPGTYRSADVRIALELSGRKIVADRWSSRRAPSKPIVRTTEDEPWS